MYHNFFKFLKFVTLFLLLILSTLAYSQNQKIDSLKQLLSSREGIDRFDVLYELAFECVDVNNSQALQYAEEAEKVGLEFGDSARIVKGGLIRGLALRKLDQLDQAIEKYKQVLAIAKRIGLKSEVKYLLNSLAISFTYKADYDNALEYHFQSLIIREKDGDKSEISIALMNIGLVYFKLRNYEQAIEYYKRSLVLRKEINDQYNLDRLLINIGLCYNQLKDFNKARASFDEGLKVCGENCSEPTLMEAQFGLGVSFYGAKEYEEATKHFESSYLLAVKIENTRFQGENLVYLAKIEIANQEYEGAIKRLTESEKLAAMGVYNELLIDTYRQFSIVYNASKDFENAAFYQSRYISLKDSIYSEGLIKNLAKIQTNFEERQNIATIKLKEDALIRQRNLNFTIGIIAVLIGLLGFVLYRSNVVTRRVNTALSDAKSIIETQNLRLQNINRELDGKVKEKTADLLKANDELDRANKALSHVNDELDNFIYKTSHDIRGPLASLKGICSVALLDVKDPLALDYLNKLDVSSGRLNVILTRLLIVNQINNAIVGSDSIDFNSIVDDVILLEKKKGLPTRFEIKRDIQRDVELQSDRDLVRIILENLIDNAIKFYNDSERVNPFVHVKITADAKGDVVVSVIDNGIGIAEAKPDKIFQMFSRASERSGTGGIGLYLSKLATEKLGGQIHLRTTPEGYTEFYVAFPSKMPMA